MWEQAATHTVWDPISTTENPVPHTVSSGKATPRGGSLDDDLNIKGETVNTWLPPAPVHGEMRPHIMYAQQMKTRCVHDSPWRDEARKVPYPCKHAPLPVPGFAFEDQGITSLPYPISHKRQDPTLNNP
ncbi:hypothetical protein QQ045_032822 [Rhodiola kirilowii]